MGIRSSRTLMACIFAMASTLAQAGDTIKVGRHRRDDRHLRGLRSPYCEWCYRLYEAYGDTVGGKKVELIIRDSTGPAPDVAKRLAQELVVKDNVDFIVWLRPYAQTRWR